MAKVRIKTELDKEDGGYGPAHVHVEVDGEKVGGGGVGGESEDNNIIRDYSWIVPSFKALAVKLGADVELLEIDMEDE